MASSAIRKPWYARVTFWLLIITTWFFAAAFAQGFGWWIWLVWLAFLIAVNSRNPGSKAKPTDLPTAPAPAPVTAEQLAAVKPGNALGFFFSGKAKLDALNLQLAQHNTFQRKLAEEISYFESTLLELPDFNAATDNEEQLFIAEGVSLVEPRKGKSITESTSRNSGRPFIGVPVGGVFLGASGRSSSKSTSVSTPAVDELTLVEEDGRFIASTQGIAYVGEMFNRKADYSAIIDWTGEGFQLRISASNKGTNWIVIFARPGDMWVVGALLDAADEIPARALDTSGKATAPEIAAAVVASIAMQKDKFAEAKEIAAADVAAIESHIDLLRKQFPSWVQ
jgi:hypothetical protein